MTQIEMILENIRLGHIEQLMQEATSDLEVIRGQRLINESIMAIQGALLQEFDASQYLPEEEPMVDPATGTMVAGGLGLGAAGYRYGQGAGNALRAAKTMYPYGVAPAMRAAGTQMMNKAVPQAQADMAAAKQAAEQTKQAVQNGYANLRNRFVK
jgi:hypothetical protein